MEEEDIIQLHTSCESDRDESSHELEPNGETLGQSMDDAEIEEGQLILETEIAGNAVVDSSYLCERISFIETAKTEISDYLTPNTEDVDMNERKDEEGQFTPEKAHDENAGVSLSALHENTHETSGSNPKKDGDSVSGVKRTRTTFDEQQPSVHVKYYCLSSQSKRKLEELLREWSEWHARNRSPSQDQNELSESGDEIYFPALATGTDKTSAVSFWMENEIRTPQNKDFNPVEDDSVPLYDRGFALGSMSADGSTNLEGDLELLDAPRCFNCASYNHSLKECPKPRDNVAVNNSRKQLKSKRNQTAGMRNLSRYYQDSPGGKYEGLRPGVLNPDTRRLLGLGEFDPPPWLNRMREIGYPPGYLEPEDENLPSGITIFADEEIKDETEEGEILEAEKVELPKKLSVNFPGINAPIPQNADERLWAPKPSNSDRYRSNHSSEYNGKARNKDHNNRDFKDDDSLGYDRASRRHVDHGFRSPPHTGSSSGRSSPLDSEDSLAYRLYNSFSYSSGKRISEHSNGSDASRGDNIDNYSSRRRDRNDRHGHRNGR